MNNILDTIHSPRDVKHLNLSQLEQLAQEIRERMISVLAKTGGHLGPNLGVVELTIAMHVIFDTPRDHFVFDVSHQSYIHKLLTGRREKFDTMRQPRRASMMLMARAMRAQRFRPRSAWRSRAI